MAAERPSAVTPRRVALLGQTLPKFGPSFMVTARAPKVLLLVLRRAVSVERDSRAFPIKALVFWMFWRTARASWLITRYSNATGRQRRARLMMDCTESPISVLR